MNDDFKPEDRISGSAAPIKTFSLIVPAIIGGIAAMYAIQGYVLHQRPFSPGKFVDLIGGFCAFGVLSLAFLRRLMDQAYAQTGVLSLRKGASLIRVPYENIKEMGVCRGTYGQLAWVLTRKTTGRGRLVLFMASDDYARSWPTRKATQHLWDLVNQRRDDDI